jgi:hypothetical protein
MRKPIFCLILLLLLNPADSKSQSIEKGAAETLENLFDRLAINHDDNDKLRINDSIRMIIDSYVSSDTVFTHRFDNLRFLGQVISPDSLLKIVSWNLILYNEPSRYNSYIIRKMDSGIDNKIYKLHTGYKDASIMTDTTYFQTEWYGALYYDLKPLKATGKQLWVLLGIDYGNPEVTRKIIDALSFGPDDALIFGYKFFQSGEDVKFRVVFEYSSLAIMSLRFRSDRSILFDHLVPFAADGRPSYGPDYSFDAYNFENGMWKLKINVDEFHEK